MSIQHGIRVVLVLDREQLLVVGAVELLLPVLLLPVGLIEVNAAARGGRIDHGLQDIGGIVLTGGHLGGGGLGVPVAGEQADAQGVAPGGQHGVVGVLLLGDVEGLAGQRGVALGRGGVADRGHDAADLAAVDEHGARQDAAAGEWRVVGEALRQGAEVVAEVLVVALRDVVGVLILDASVLQVVEEGLQSLVDLGRVGHAGHGDTPREELVVGERVGVRVSGVDKVGEKRVECRDGFPELVVANLGVVKDDRGATKGVVGVQPRGHGQSDGVGTAATAAHGPVEVRVLLGGSDQVLAVHGHHFPLQNIVGGQTVQAREH